MKAAERSIESQNFILQQGTTKVVIKLAEFNGQCLLLDSYIVKTILRSDQHEHTGQKRS